MSRLWILVMPLFVLAGCSASKTTPTPSAELAELEDLETRQLVQKIEERIFKYKFLSADAAIDATIGDKNQSVKADIRMKNDSIIWVSVKIMLGFEAARVMITPERIQILDRINSQYINKPFSYLNTEYNVPVSFRELQRLLIGNLTYLEDDDTKTSGKENAFYFLQSKNETLAARAELDPRDYSLAKLNLQEADSDRKVTVTYSGYNVQGTQLFPNSRILQVKAEDDVYVKMDLKNIKVDETLTFPFHVSDKYEKIK